MTACLRAAVVRSLWDPSVEDQAADHLINMWDEHRGNHRLAYSPGPLNRRDSWPVKSACACSDEGEESSRQDSGPGKVIFRGLWYADILRGSDRCRYCHDTMDNCRRDLLDHVIVLNERHLKRLMNEYVRYYHDDRTHLALDKGTPDGREAVSRSDVGNRIIAMPRLGGLHHRYDLAA